MNHIRALVLRGLAPRTRSRRVGHIGASPSRRVGHKERNLKKMPPLIFYVVRFINYHKS